MKALFQRSAANQLNKRVSEFKSRDLGSNLTRVHLEFKNTTVQLLQPIIETQENGGIVVSESVQSNQNEALSS